MHISVSCVFDCAIHAFWNSPRPYWILRYCIIEQKLQTLEFFCATNLSPLLLIVVGTDALFCFAGSAVALVRRVAPIPVPQLVRSEQRMQMWSAWQQLPLWSFTIQSLHPKLTREAARLRFNRVRRTSSTRRQSFSIVVGCLGDKYCDILTQRGHRTIRIKLAMALLTQRITPLVSRESLSLGMWLISSNYHPYSE